MFDAYGLASITTAQLEDLVGLMRRLLRGELVRGHDGPAGSFPALKEMGSPTTSTFPSPAASGSPEQCVDAIEGQCELGCDGVILHGASPTELEPVVTAYRRRRPQGRFNHLAANPAGTTGQATP